jgi:hypothetical protein
MDNCIDINVKNGVQHGVYLIALSLGTRLFEHLRTDFAAAHFFSIRYGGVAALNWILWCFENVLNSQNFLALYKLNLLPSRNIIYHKRVSRRLNLKLMSFEIATKHTPNVVQNCKKTPQVLK